MSKYGDRIKAVGLLLILGFTVHAQNKFPVLRSGWHVHDMQRPLPEKVTPGKTDSDAPSDAIVLFDGSNLNEWIGDNDPKKLWKLENNYMEVVPGKTSNLQTRKSFGDIQLHVEWATPTEINEKAQRRGNSGIFLMSLYEIQIMDAWENTAYPDGMAGAVYGQNPALVNVAKKPGEWQSYDIFFTAPVFNAGKLVTPAYVTVLQNGVLVQNHVEIYGPTKHNKALPYVEHAEKLPILLQNHGQAVRFRNIWVRELDKGDGFEPLFDGKTLKGWKSARNINNSSYGVFSVNEEEKAIHVYAGEEPGSEQVNDLLFTETSYSSYILKMEYKWGDNRFGERAEIDRDAGLLLHVAEDITKGWDGWPASIEMQMGESNPLKVEEKRYHTGDTWIIGLNNTAEIPQKGRFYAPEEPKQLLGVDKKFQGVWTPFGKEKPHGEWNQILVKVEGGKKAFFFLNGEQVMEITNMKTKVNDSEVPLSSGRIGLQAEYAEVLYRNILIKEIQ